MDPERKAAYQSMVRTLGPRTSFGAIGWRWAKRLIAYVVMVYTIAFMSSGFVIKFGLSPPYRATDFGWMVRWVFLATAFLLPLLLMRLYEKRKRKWRRKKAAAREAEDNKADVADREAQRSGNR